MPAIILQSSMLNSGFVKKKPAAHGKGLPSDSASAHPPLQFHPLHAFPIGVSPKQEKPLLLRGLFLSIFAARCLSVAYIDVKTASIAEWSLSPSSLQP